MRVNFQPLFLRIVSLILFTFSFFLSTNQIAHAEFSNLVPCKDSPAFEKRLNSEVKKLENRLKFYTPESKEAKSLIHEVEVTKGRFSRYGNSNLLCGKEGLPRIIASGQWDHANEFVIPGILFLYITGWIGWVGRKYLSYASQTSDAFEKEIILDVPVAFAISTSGFLWPIEAWNEFKTGKLLANEEDVTVSPR
jgi:photosystem I subunit 3